MNRVEAFVLALGMAAALLGAVPTPGRAASATRGDLRVTFDERTRRFSFHRTDTGPLLTDGVVLVTQGRRAFSSDEADYVPMADADDAGNAALLRVSLRAAGKPPILLHFELIGDEQTVELRAATSARADALQAVAHMRMGPEPLAGFTEEERPDDGRVLTTTLGMADVPGARALYAPDLDMAVTLATDGQVGFEGDPAANGYELVARREDRQLRLRLTCKPHYYRDTLGIAFYQPIEKSHYWTTAPCVAMTWYGIQGWKGSPAQTKEWLYPQIGWVAQHLLPHAERLVFQLDDNYAKHDDRYMRDVSDFIRSKGLIPGIWFTPFTVAPPEVHDEHPDWFIHDADGKPIKTFGGVSYNGYTLDVTSAGAVGQWYAMWWGKTSRTWNFDFFKIDGQPNVIDAYSRAVGLNTSDYRLGLDIGRERVGPGKFINGCWGIPLAAIGKVNGSRTGGDTGNNPHAINVILRWNFLNNVAWWCDPDAAANLHKATRERTRLNTQARALTGQQFLTDDVWTSVPPEIAYIWQRAMPSLDIKPANLYPITNWQEYDVFDLKVRKPWGQWDVAGLFNYTPEARAQRLDLGRLHLQPGQYHVYDFWEGEYLGLHDAGDSLSFGVEPYEGKLLSVHAHTRAPVVLSTSRHISQGGLDLEDVAVRPADGGYVVEGRSSHLVTGDPHVVAVYANRCAPRRAQCDAGDVEVEDRGEVVNLRITPQRPGEAVWRLRLARPTRPRLALGRTLVWLVGEDEQREARVRLRNVGPRQLRWTAETDAEWLFVHPTRGQLGPYADQAEMLVYAAPAALEPDTAYAGEVVVRAQGARNPPQRLTVRLRTPPPPNLALGATATASSVWDDRFGAERANDGDTGTRWNAARGNESGCWLALQWPEAQTFDTVVVDEVLDWGPRIEEWVLEARVNGEWHKAAEGAGMGGTRRIDLPVTTASGLRLTIPRASDTPTISEIRVEYRRPPQRS